MENEALIFIHGLEGNSQGVKATLLRSLFPQILTPDFTGSLEERMRSLENILGDTKEWVIVGSSFGGLMAAMFTCEHPGQVRKLVLLAPALIWPSFAANPPPAVDTPTIVYHGTRDHVIPVERARIVAERIFRNLAFHSVDDDHGLYQTVHSVDWGDILSQ